MNINTRSDPKLATSAQRESIRRWMGACELPLDRVTVMHRDVFRDAGIPWNEGRDLDAELCTITLKQASCLMTLLEGRS